MKIFQPTITGSLNASGLIYLTGLASSSANSILTYDSASGQLFFTASSALNAGGLTNTGSLLTTASVSLNTITFTKGDGSTFPITINTGSGGGGGTNIFMRNKTNASSTDTITVNQSIFNPSNLIIQSTSIFIIDADADYYVLGDLINSGSMIVSGTLKIEGALYTSGSIIGPGIIE